MASRSWLLSALLSCLLTSGPAHAQGADLRSIAQRSDAIVLARCVETRSHWDEHTRVIVTDLTLAVERSFKGGAATSVTVRTLGGRLGSLGMGASHVSTFPPGVRVVALLRHSTFGPYFVVTSAHVGPLLVTDDVAPAQVTVGADVVGLEELVAWLAANAR